MASRRPVIASDKVGGARDLITPDVTGWVFESGNLPQLTAVVGRALTRDARTLGDMGAAAERESARWSVEAAARGIELAVRDLSRHERGRQAGMSVDFG
jgi:glycosyltransferase involved in cell wall biosynthesis